MTSLSQTDTSIIVRKLLLKMARKKGRQFEELSLYYVMERFLYRLGQSKYCDRFILKGALLFHVWKILDSRATRDIDMLAAVDNSSMNLERIIRDICNIETEFDDEVIFDSESVVAKEMQLQREYSGIRVKFKAMLKGDKHPINVRIDIGFGDAVMPAPEKLAYPTIFDQPAPSLWGYHPETVIAEKLHTSVEKGLFNSRLKDFYDLWMLLRSMDFNKKSLTEAIRATFERRGRIFEIEEVTKTLIFYGITDDRQEEWNRFRQEGKYEEAPKDLSELCFFIAQSIHDYCGDAFSENAFPSIGKILGGGELKGNKLLIAVQQLLVLGADVNEERNNGHCPLNIAVSKGIKQVAMLLIDAGADFEMRDRSGLSAFEWALTRGMYDLAYTMYKEGHPYTPRHPNSRLKVPYQNLYEFEMHYF